MEEIRRRIQRLLAAIGETVEEEFSKFPPTKTVTDSWVFVRQDFTGGLNDAQIANIAFTAIHAVAHLPDHLRSWAKRNARPMTDVDDVISGSSAIQVIIDLSNRDKHGASRDAGCSGRAPRVENLKRTLRLSGGPQPGSGVTVQFIPGGAKVHGPGSAAVVVTGDVLAKDGARIGDLSSLLEAALDAWEKVLARWGLPLGNVV